jgi:hypothetical protein
MFYRFDDAILLDAGFTESNLWRATPFNIGLTKDIKFNDADNMLGIQ